MRLEPLLFHARVSGRAVTVCGALTVLGAVTAGAAPGLVGDIGAGEVLVLGALVLAVVHFPPVGSTPGERGTRRLWSSIAGGAPRLAGIELGSRWCLLASHVLLLWALTAPLTAPGEPGVSGPERGALAFVATVVAWGTTVAGCAAAVGRLGTVVALLYAVPLSVTTLAAGPAWAAPFAFPLDTLADLAAGHALGAGAWHVVLFAATWTVLALIAGGRRAG